MPPKIVVEIIADSSKFIRELKKADSSVSGLSKAAGVAGLAIAGGLAVGLEKSVAAAVDAQDSQRRLGQAFKIAGESLQSYKGRIDAAQGSARKLGFTDTEVRDSLGSLITATHDAGLSMKDLNIAQDLARFTGKDLVTTTRYLTAAMAGSQKATKALGLTVQPVTDTYDRLKATMGKTIDPTEKLTLAHAKLVDKLATSQNVIKAASEATRGQAKVFSETAAGGMAQYKAQMDHLEVTMGKGLLPALTGVASALSDLVGFFVKHTTVAKVLIGTIAALGGAMIAVSAATTIAVTATKIWTAAQWLLNAALTANPIGIVIISLVALGAALVVAWQKSETFRNIVTGTWNAVKAGAQLVLDFFRTNWKTIAVLISGPFAPIVLLATDAFGVRSALVGAFNAVKARASEIIGDIVGFFREMPGRIGNAIGAGAGALKKSITDLFGKVIDWVKGVFGISSPSSVFESIGRNVVLGFVKGVGGAAGMLKDYVIKLAKDFVGSSFSQPDPFKGTGLTPATKGASGNVALGRQMAAARGWTGANWDALNRLWIQESGWSNFAKNKTSGAYGIPQALPESKLPFAGRQAGGSDAGAQIGWGLNYISGRYGTPSAAWAHEVAFNWYDRGGILPPGLTLALNQTGRPEMVVPAGARTGGGTEEVHIHLHGNYVDNKQAFIRDIRDGIVQAGRRNGGGQFAGQG